jgi:hypothetical protein
VVPCVVMLSSVCERTAMTAWTFSVSLHGRVIAYMSVWQFSMTINVRLTA